jgi:polyisoprenoid-binding protein YceI
LRPRLDAASIDTGDAQRDAHLRSADFLDAETDPTITFTSTRIERGNQDQLRLVGNMRIRDSTREVVLETTFNGRGKNPYGHEVAGFTAETEIDRKDFGLQWNGGGLLVGNKLEVALEVQAIKQSQS